MLLTAKVNMQATLLLLIELFGSLFFLTNFYTSRLFRAKGYAKGGVTKLLIDKL